MKLGYLLPTREQVMRGQHDTAPLLDAARLARNLGYDSVWVGDSLIARPRHDPLTLLAAVASSVLDVHIGTAVLLPALRNPVVLAQQLATIDRLSGGRLIVGAGIAADAPSIHAEFAAAGVPFEKRVGRFVEGFALCRALWRGEPVDWQGRWQLDGATLAPTPVRPEGPPIWVAASIPAGIRRAARLFDGWLPIGPNAQAVAEGHALLMQTAREHARPQPTTAVYVTICVDEDSAAAEAQIDEYLRTYYAMDPAIMRRVQACKGGPIGEVMAFLASFVEAGAEHLIIRLVGDHAQALTQIADRRG